MRKKRADTEQRGSEQRQRQREERERAESREAESRDSEKRAKGMREGRERRARQKRENKLLTFISCNRASIGALLSLAPPPVDFKLVSWQFWRFVRKQDVVDSYAVLWRDNI
jgi:hypothetical protein